MFDGILILGWTGQPITPEQFIVLRNAAARHLRGDKKRRSFNFSHRLCQGKMTRKEQGLFVTISGTFFTADLGLVGGERWTVDFLIPSGSENEIVDDNTVVVVATPLAVGDVGGRGNHTLH